MSNNGVHSSRLDSATNLETAIHVEAANRTNRANSSSADSLNDFIATLQDTDHVQIANIDAAATSSASVADNTTVLPTAMTGQALAAQLKDIGLSNLPVRSVDAAPPEPTMVPKEDPTDTITLPIAEYQFLAIKAAVYDRLFFPSTPILVNGVTGIPPPSEHTFPPDCTLTITNLPQTLKLADLIHSLAAPGGIRYVRLIPAPGSSTALVVFPRAAAARAYAHYVSLHGFFISRRTSPNARTSRGETAMCIQIGNSTSAADGNIKRLWVLKRHIPSATLILPSTAPDGHGDPEYPGQSRCIRFLASAEKVAKQIGMFRPSNGRDVVIEHFSFFPRNGRDCTLIRFAGVRDAAVVRKYFELLKGWEGMLESARDPCDKNPEALEWDGLRKRDDADGGWVGGETLGGGELMEFSGKATEIEEFKPRTVKE